MNCWMFARLQNMPVRMCRAQIDSRSANSKSKPSRAAQTGHAHLCSLPGRRAGAKAIEQFECAGCDDCVLVEGGTQAWIDAGLPVHRGARSVLPLMRQVQILVGALNVRRRDFGARGELRGSQSASRLGCGLLFAGITGTCGMALLLAQMPWNRGQISSCHCCTNRSKT
jgi:hypothetical protein